MDFRKITGRTMFKPSFGGKKGTTHFYQAFVDGERAGEIEVKPVGTNGKPEILSLYTDIRGVGAGRFLVDEVLKIYLKDEVYVMTTPDSKPFWLKMGAVEVDGFLCVFKKKMLEHLMLFEDFESKDYPTPNRIKFIDYVNTIKNRESEPFSKYEIEYFNKLKEINPTVHRLQVGADKKYLYLSITKDSDILKIEIRKFEDQWFLIDVKNTSLFPDETGAEERYICDQFEEVKGLFQQETNLYLP